MSEIHGLAVDHNLGEKLPISQRFEHRTVQLAFKAHLSNSPVIESHTQSVFAPLRQPSGSGLAHGTSVKGWQPLVDDDRVEIGSGPPPCLLTDHSGRR